MSECYIYHKDSCDGDNCDVFTEIKKHVTELENRECFHCGDTGWMNDGERDKLRSRLAELEAENKELAFQLKGQYNVLTRRAKAEKERLIAMVKSFEPVPQGHTDEGDAMLSALAQLEQALQV